MTETESCVSSGLHEQSSAGPGVGSVMVEQRHTLPRGRSECESHGWPERGERGATKAGSETGETAETENWCPGCNNASCPMSNVSSCR